MHFMVMEAVQILSESLTGYYTKVCLHSWWSQNHDVTILYVL